ncbi:MAG: transcriptional regulator [Novosphingobium pentaromativorans]|uniref:Transcriptional regulator n=1 Tax=Novosphingobium pentaromativorans TaxID=205844 RepID=A0A2W5NL43_9SPHN|nr:MAG: transcriptional regulator [Novosphingobium pentaromativorans]
MSNAPDRLIRLSEVIEIVGYCKAMIYRKVRQGTFPAPYKPGGSSSRWSYHEVTAWVASVKGDA